MYEFALLFYILELFSLIFLVMICYLGYDMLLRLVCLVVDLGVFAYLDVICFCFYR